MCENCFTFGIPGGRDLGSFRLTDHLRSRCRQRGISLCDVALAIAHGHTFAARDGAIGYQLKVTTRCGEAVTRERAIGVVAIVRRDVVVTTTYRKEVRSTGCLATLGDLLRWRRK